MKNHSLTDNQVDDLVEKLGGEAEALRIIHSESLTSSRAWNMTIKLGLANSPETYRAALLRSNVRIGMSGGDLLNHVTVSHEQVELDLVALSAADFGLKNNTKFRTICATGLARGYKLCPAEAAIVLRLVYQNQPKGERLGIAMEAITGSDDHPGIFVIEHDVGGLCLYGGSGHPDLYWKDGVLFVFVKPRRFSTCRPNQQLDNPKG